MSESQEKPNIMHEYLEKIRNYAESNKNQLIIIALILIIRILILFGPGNVFDVPENYYMGMRILSGDNPYLVTYPNNWDSSKLPPLNFVVYSVFILLFGETIFAIHFVAVFFDLLILIYLYRLSKLIWDEKAAKLSVILYGFSPFTIFMLVLAQNDFIVTFFMLASIYYFLLGKKYSRIISSLFMGLGIMTKFIPILVFIPIFLRLFFEHKNKKGENGNQLGHRLGYRLLLQVVLDLIKYIFTTIIVILAILIPFALPDFLVISSKILDFFGYTSQSMSYSFLVPWLVDTQINLFNIMAINPLNLIEIGSFSLIIIFYIMKRTSFSEKEFIKIAILVYSLFNIFSLNFTVRNIFWFIPLLIAYIAGKGSKIHAQHEGHEGNEGHVQHEEHGDQSLNKELFRFKSRIGIVFLIYIGIIVGSIITFSILISINFGITPFSNPMVLNDLNWALHPDKNEEMRLYFDFILVPMLILSVIYAIFIKKMKQKGQNAVLNWINVWVFNPWVYYIFLGLYYVNFFDYMTSNLLSFIISLVSLVCGISIGIYLIISRLNDVLGEKLSIRVIQTNISGFFNKVRGFVFSKELISDNTKDSQESDKINIDNTQNAISINPMLEISDNLQIKKADTTQNTKADSFNFKKMIYNYSKTYLLPFLKIWLLPLILRVCLIFLPFNPGDHEILFYSGESILNGYIPYRDFNLGGLIFPGGYEHPHPPLFHILQIIPVLMAGRQVAYSFLSYKLYYLILEFFMLYFFHKILRKIWDRKKIEMFFIFYGVCPATFYPLGFIGMQEITTALFIAAGLWYFIDKKYVLSSIIFGLGVMDSIFPIFIFIILLVTLLQQKDYKRTTISALSFLSVIFIISLPFLIICPNDYLYFLSLVFNYDTTFSLNVFIPFNSVLELPIVTLPIINFQFRFKHLYLLSILSLSLLIPLKYKGFNKDTRNSSISNILSRIFFFMLFVPIMFKSVHFRLIFWMLPYILVFFISNFHMSDHSRIRFEKSMIHSFFLSLTTQIVFLIYLFSVGIDINVRSEYYHLTFVWFLIFQTIWFLAMLFSTKYDRRIIGKGKKAEIENTNSKYGKFGIVSIISIYTYINFLSTFIIFEIELDKIIDIWGYFAFPILSLCLLVFIKIYLKKNTH